MSIAAPSVSFKKVRVVIEGNCLLESFSLKIEPGTWFGIVGPNGGGKSTLIKSLAGLINYEGDICLNWPLASPGNIGYMPQRIPIDESLPVTVSDYLRISCERRPVWLAKKHNLQLQEVIDKLGVSSLLNKKLGTLSAGERQRTVLCAALANQPQLLLLDEPLAGIDKMGKTRILETLEHYHQSGGSIVMVEHHWDIVSQHCQKVAWVDGKIKRVAAPSEVLASLSQELSPFDLREANV